MLSLDVRTENGIAFTVTNVNCYKCYISSNILHCILRMYKILKYEILRNNYLCPLSSTFIEVFLL